MTSGARAGGRSAHELIERADLDGALRAMRGAIARTPTLDCPELALGGGRVALKAECLQLTGSFKLRGALSKIAALGELARAGLVTASAGNHGRAVAQAALLTGLSCEVFMPPDVPASKLAAVRALGAETHLAGESVEDALSLAAARASETGAAFVHPFDDLDVIAGQGTLAVELLEEVPDLARVVIPVGGGGLASGIGIALRRGRANVQVVGVQARACAPYAHALGDRPGMLGVASGTTIADGIAIKRPGELTLALLGELLDGVETVSEEQIADAMVFLAERAKLVAEGAGAVAVAALRSGQLAPVSGATVAIVSGGNVDSGLLAALLQRHETEEGRRLRVYTRVADRPGSLAGLLELVARARANLVSVEHVREAVPLPVRETGVELTLQTRGPEHTVEILAALRAAGYELRTDERS